MDKKNKLGPTPPYQKRRRTSAKTKRRRNTSDPDESAVEVDMEMGDELSAPGPVASTSSAALASTAGGGRRVDGGDELGEAPEERVAIYRLTRSPPRFNALAIMPATGMNLAAPIVERQAESLPSSLQSAEGLMTQELPVGAEGIVGPPYAALQAGSRVSVSVPVPVEMQVAVQMQMDFFAVHDAEPMDEPVVILSDELPTCPMVRQQTRPPPVQTQLNIQQSHVDDHGWQESRLLLTERSEFLLNNSRMSDIRFLVGETNVEIFGHKTILAMGSPVFEAQFFGSLRSDVETTIELPDLEPETFLLFLKYLYTDTLDETIDDMKVLQLLRPAKKYIVPHLIEKCSDILMSELRAETVFQVYNYAVFFDLKKLEGACLRFIDRECEAIVQTDEFTMLNSQTLADFLKRDGLNIKEHVLFKAVLRWAELECERMSVEATDSNIRGALADNLRLVRFPTMTSEEFATEVASRNILTAEESRSIFIFLCSGNPNRLLSPALIPDFPVKKRGFYPQQYLVSRFSGEPQAHSLNYRSGEIYTYRINFKTDRQIFFKGVNIFSIKCGMNAQYVDQRRFNGAVGLYDGDREGDLNRAKAHKQFTRELSLESEHETSSGSRYFPVLFDQEVRIPANQTFTISAAVSVASSSYHQQPLNTCMGTDEVVTAVVKCAEDLSVNFTFSTSFGDSTVGKYTQSQIPEILFSL